MVYSEPRIELGFSFLIWRNPFESFKLYRVMALLSSTLPSPILPLRFPKFTELSSASLSPRSYSYRFLDPNFESLSVGTSGMLLARRADAAAAVASSVQGAVTEAMNLIQSAPPTWKSAIFNNLLIFVMGSPILVTGLSASGIAAAFLLGTLTWRAFGSPGFLLVAAYFIIGTAATKVKMSQKEAQGVAEKRKGRRGPGSVLGSSAAGCVCAILSIYGVGGAAFSQLLRLGFVSSFCTKVADTVSSEIGKAYGKITYLVTTFKVVPRGTEGAVSVEGTLAGILASSVLASIGCFLSLITPSEAAICVLASQIANFGESIIGAALQDKEGFKWLNNDLVNVINISLGSILAILMQQFVLHNWLK